MDLITGIIGMFEACLFCIGFYLSIKLYIKLGCLIEDAFDIMTKQHERKIVYVYRMEDYYARN